ncbi:MAG: sulfur carrier protein ThiS [Wolinella sp.]
MSEFTCLKRLLINGQKCDFAEASTLSEVMQTLGIVNKVMAAAVNTQIIKASEWENFVPKDGDRIELLHFVGGG